MASEQNHPWCRNVQRDEAIRAAEDAAAAEREPPPDHRDLPSAVHDLRRRVECLEAVADHWRRQCEAAADAENREAAVVSREGVTFTENGVFREAKTPSGTVNPAADASGGDVDGLRDIRDSRNAKADGLRTERVTLEITQQETQGYTPVRSWPWDEILDDWGLDRPGESVRIVEDLDAASDEAIAHGATLNALAEARGSLAAANRGMDRLTAERDAARDECERLRSILPPESERGRGVGEGSWAVFAQKVVAERDEARALHVKWVELATQARIERERLKARVAELEAAAAPAANAGGEANNPAAPDSSQEPVAWGVRFPAGNVVPFKDRELAEAKTKEANDRAMAAVGISDAVKCVPLYAAPHPPRGWLTEEERKAVEAAVAVVDQRGRTNIGVALDALLARSTPPRVRRPRPKVIPGGTVMELIDHINEAWIAAIREAGGEVGE